MSVSFRDAIDFRPFDNHRQQGAVIQFVQTYQFAQSGVSKGKPF